MIKLKTHLENIKVNVSFTKPNVEKCILREISISEILSLFSTEFLVLQSTSI